MKELEHMDAAAEKTRISPKIPKLKKSKITRRTMKLYVMVLPVTVLMFLFHYLPIYGIVIAFQDYSPFAGVFKSTWVGLKHFTYFLTDDSFWRVFKNTVILSCYDIIFGFPAPLVFALLVNEVMRLRFKKVIQTISYLPHFLSWVVVAGVFSQILSPNGGVVNIILHNVFDIDPVYFLSKSEWFRATVVLIEIWKGVGWGAILYFSIMAGIDPTQYEAVIIDGGGKIKQALHVTLPALIPVIMINLVFRLSSIFSVGFERIFLLQTPLVYDVSDVISTYIYRMGLSGGQFSATAAIGLAQSLLGFILLTVANKVSKLITGYGIY